MKRDIDNELQEWHNLENRKVLLLWGARQLGKMFSLRQLGETFQYLLKVNFEEGKAVKTFFDGSLNPRKIAEKLSAYYAIPIFSGKTLLFLSFWNLKMK